MDENTNKVNSLFKLRSLNGCKLKIGNYPSFVYDATNGGGEAILTSSNSNKIIKFDLKHFSIPSLSYKTTKILGIRLPPKIKIEILPKRIEGFTDLSAGLISINLQAEFIFSIGQWIQAPPLFINTCLSNKNKPIEKILSNKDYSVQLIGESYVKKTNSMLLNHFLSLPNKAIAILMCEVTYINDQD